MLCKIDADKHWFIKPRIGGYSYMGWLNLLLVQWFFVRIEVTIHECAPHCTTMPGAYFGLMGFVLPCTGWWNNYVKLGPSWRLYPAGNVN